MDVHYETGVHQDLNHDMCMNSMLPSLEHVSVGNCSDEMFDDEDVATAISENGDTDYDLAEDLDSDEGEDEEEEEEEEEEEDESQIHALVDDLELKFRSLVASKICEAEQFFDDANAFQRPTFQSNTVEKHNDEGNAMVFHVDYNEDEEVLLDQVGSRSKERNRNAEETNGKFVSKYVKDMSTQTDPLLSPPSVSSTSTLTSENKELTATPEQARAEIGQLRDVRESLIVQRQQWAAQLKQAEDRNEDEAKNAQCKVYEIEEAIEAVDTAIEFKNEVVLGHPQSKISSYNMTPGTNEAELVTRLETLSIEELRRLLCIYFAKVVELRSSSRRLEKQCEHAENSIDQLSRRLAKEHKLLREMHTEYQARIRMILSSNNPNSALYSCFRRMDDQLAAAHKKQHDLERSLTELLVRHGYLVNGADYDVKQVVKMLGIESQLTGAGHRPYDGDASGRLAIDQAAAAAQHSSRSGLQKGTRGLNLGHRRNGRQLDGHELSRIHRDARLAEGWEREHRHAIAQAPPQGAEVKREKRRLIIQPSNNGATSSGYSHHHGGNSSHGYNHHYSHPHHSAHGSNHHGYK